MLNSDLNEDGAKNHICFDKEMLDYYVEIDDNLFIEKLM